MNEPTDPHSTNEAIDSEIDAGSWADAADSDKPETTSSTTSTGPGTVESDAKLESPERQTAELQTVNSGMANKNEADSMNSQGAGSELADPLKNDCRESQRRLIERLSGWRLHAFFFSAAMNLGLLVVLLVVPLILDLRRIYVSTAWVSASHCVFLLAVAGFRFPIATKFVLGFVHATVCVWALSSIGAMPWVKLGSFEVATLYLIPMLTLLVTTGGIVVAQVGGFHRSKRFSVTDIILLVSAFAILFPLIQQAVPRTFFTQGISSANLRSAFVLAALCGLTCLVVSNMYLKFIPVGGPGLSALMIAIGWFLFLAIVNWNLCQFGFLVALWILISLVPIYGLVRSPVAGAVE